MASPRPQGTTDSLGASTAAELGTWIGGPDACHREGAPRGSLWWEPRPALAHVTSLNPHGTLEVGAALINTDASWGESQGQETALNLV